jgi:hypothetical protein
MNSERRSSLDAEDRAVPGVEATVRKYDLGGERTMVPHYYLVQTEVATHSS